MRTSAESFYSRAQRRAALYSASATAFLAAAPIHFVSVAPRAVADTSSQAAVNGPRPFRSGCSTPLPHFPASASVIHFPRPHASAKLRCLSPRHGRIRSRQFIELYQTLPSKQHQESAVSALPSQTLQTRNRLFLQATPCVQSLSKPNSQVATFSADFIPGLSIFSAPGHFVAERYVHRKAAVKPIDDPLLHIRAFVTDT